MTSSAIHVGVDVGGTKILAVALRAPAVAGAWEPEAVRTATVPMPGRLAPTAEIEAAVLAAVAEVCPDEPAAGVGLSVAGLVDAAGEHLRFAAHLPWRAAPLRRRFAELLGTPVRLENDANCAAYAEIVAGAARGVSSALLIAVGTGIGGAVVLDGRVVRGAQGGAGEFGHMQVVPDGLPCECGLRGCWEQYCSGRALERVMRVAVGAHLDGPEVAALARSGDRVAREAIASVGTWLGVGAAGLVSAFDPETVVVGGGVSAVGDLLLEPARRALRDSLQGKDFRTVPALVPARFGPEAGAIGAALYSLDGPGTPAG
ncbi:ROK family protein [Nocardioides sambongensis]|uniref:ROK family protein n=1 Tax=Nocardioides sambongensis TaxID=2589074 RepID=UPI00112DD535|nr:ROK family protein [Nocardioides sambongensis]